MIARPQDLHYLHGQHYNDEFPGFSLRHDHAEVLLPTADDHMFHDVIHGIAVNPRTLGHDVTDLGPVMPKELSSAGCKVPAGIRRKHAIKILLVV